MKKLILLLSVITLSYASIGKISAIRGDAVVISNGSEIQAVLNQELEESDIIKTGNNARLQIIFNDNTVTTLGKNTSLEIKQYLLDGKNSKVNLVVDEGSFKVITGEISKLARKNFSLKAQTATIGIRGTVFVGEVGFNVNKLACLQGAIDVKLGNKTSLINSGKQISFKDTKVIKIENLKANDFSLTKANIIQEKQEVIQEKKEEKQSQNKVSSITLSSDIKAQNPNSNSNNAIKLEEQTIKEEIIADNLENYLDNKLDNENKEENGNTKPIIPINPSKPINDKYFTHADTKNFYYSSNANLNDGSIKKDAAELNVKKGNLNIYSQTTNGSNTTDFKKINIYGNQYVNISKTTDNANAIKNTQHTILVPTTSKLDGNSNYVLNSEHSSFYYSANKEELKAHILGDRFEMLKDTGNNFIDLSKNWVEFEKYLSEKNKDFFSSVDVNKDFYYHNSLESIRLSLINPSITYYFANNYSSKKLYADLKYANKIYYTESNASGEYYMSKEFAINNKTISPIDGSGPLNINANASGSSGNATLKLEADKKYADFSFSNLIKETILASSSDSKSVHELNKTQFDKHVNKYKEKYFAADDDKNFYYSGQGSSIKLNPVKQSVDSYIVYNAGLGDIFRITFDKNFGDATYIQRSNGTVLGVYDTQKYDINNIKSASNDYSLQVESKQSSDYIFQLNADKIGAELKGSLVIQGKKFNVNSDRLQHVDDPTGYKLIKDTYEKAYKQKK
ncbi:FecR domain-containing protein [Campylobacter sp. RM5004]|uniref:FecR family protein n=1 Tax=Campylobacter sp. RM5004 TaxID=1660078 RepID=UPI001EFA7D7D|nr:FecR family protein [Campylobacter sp. RM5004]ULO02259.1 FecR domain-containing protein [Campylobacter sp. RM5004]